MRKGIFRKFKKSCGFLLALAMIVSLITGIGTMEVKAEGVQVIDDVKVTIDYSKIPDIQVGETVPNDKSYVDVKYDGPLQIPNENCYVEREGWLCKNNGRWVNAPGATFASDVTYGYAFALCPKYGYEFKKDNVILSELNGNSDRVELLSIDDERHIRFCFTLGTLKDIEEVKYGKTPETKLAEAKPAAEKVITDLTATNATTADNIINAVKAEVDKLGYGITVTMPDFNKNLATEAATGKITGTIKLTLDGKTVEVPVSLVIAKLPSAPGKVENNTNTKDNAFRSNLNETGEELSDKVLTKEEKERVANGESAEVYLEVKDISDTVSKTDKEKVETAKGDAELGMYLDLSLYKKIGNNDPKKVANTNGTVTIAIKVPTKLVNKDSGVTRTYQIVRVHNGKAEVINCKYDAKAGTITFETDKFSTYALVYKDAAKSTGTNTNTNTNSNSSGTAGNSSTGVVKPTSPKTGDSSNLILWFALIVISGVAACYFVRKNTAVKKD